MTDKAQSLADIADVSRETFERLLSFEKLVIKWNPVINLVSKPSIPEIWQRHIIDSAQIFPHIPPDAINCLDIGSGGGFPGIVLAVMGADKAPSRRFTFVEADQRKATFLREAVRVLGLKVEVLPERVEAIGSLNADVLSARALSPLSKLLVSAQQHLVEGGVCLFPKGETYPQEIRDAKKLFNFDCSIVPSLTAPKCALLKIYGIRNA